MSRPKLQSLTTATLRCLLALCIFGLLFVSQAAAMQATKSDSRSRAVVKTAAKGLLPFEITGRIRNLYPGARVPLNVRVANPHNDQLRVRSIEVQVLDSDLSGCGREWVEPERDVTISTLVPAKSTAFLSYPVWMRADAPAACQGATWTLNFKGTGTVSGTQDPSEGGTQDPSDGGTAAPSGESDNGSVLPFTGFNLIMIVGVALSSILTGWILVARRRSGDEA